LFYQEGRSDDQRSKLYGHCTLSDTGFKRYLLETSKLAAFGQ